MKKNYLIIGFVLLSSCLIAQNTKLKVTESAEYKDKVKAYVGIQAIHTSENDNTIIIRQSKKGLLFDLFDKNLKKTYNKVVEVSKKEYYVGDVFNGKEIKVFTVFSPKKTQRTVYVHTFDLEEKTYQKKALFSADVEKSQSLFRGRNRRKTSVAISPNGNYFVVATDNIKKAVNSYTIRVFESSSLQLVFKKSYQEHTERYFIPNDIMINNEAIVYVLGKIYKKGKKEKKKGEANYQFILNKIAKDEAIDATINLKEGLHIRSLALSDTGDKLNLLGFYSENNMGRIKGGCNIEVDLNLLNVINTKTTILPLDVFKDLYRDKKAKKKKEKGTELTNFYIDYIITDNKGNTYILAEEFYTTQVYVPNANGGGSWRTIYHYDDILILKYNILGELSWGRSIFKRSKAPSYNAFFKNDELHVILNSGKNLTEKKDGRTKASKGWLESTALYDFVYSKDGEVYHDKIQNNKGNTFYSPFYGTYNNGKFIMSSFGRKKKQFMILE